MHVGTEEVLHDDATRFADKAGAANVAAHLHVWEGMPHVFLSNVATLQAARLALKLTGEFLNARLFGAPEHLALRDSDMTPPGPPV
jgi:monoterpene epsilon-lactone hydrolase